jgi:two-component system NtrC family sensor kinase
VSRAAVLVVEDEAANRDALVDYLEDEGFEPLAATDGVEALALLSARAVDVVITDLKMPRMPGLEFLEQVRARWPEVPCIIVSGQGTMSDLISAVRLGAYDFIEKPLVPLDRVAIALRRALDHGRLRRDNRATLAELERRNASLAESNAALARAKAELEEAQHQLVHAGKMAALGEMVAGVAHEINNPMGFVYSNVRVLGEALESLEQLARAQAQLNRDAGARAETVAEIDRHARRIERLLEGCRVGTERTREIIERLRRFARPGEATLHTIDLVENLEAAVTFVSHRIGEEIQVHRDYQAVPRVLGRGGEINQVFVNLLANALDAVGDRGHLWLATRERAEAPPGVAREVPGPWVEAVIRDSGRGFPADAAARLFEPFYTTKPPGQGTGLGLSVSYGIVRYHGGVIEARNHPDGGAEFRVVLPLIAAPNRGKPRAEPAA